MKTAAPMQSDHYFVKVMFDKSTYFVRDGSDLYTEADVSVSQALLGGKLNIKGLYQDKVRRCVNCFKNLFGLRQAVPQTKLLPSIQPPTHPPKPALRSTNKFQS
jgi:hypothetical protein